MNTLSVRHLLALSNCYISIKYNFHILTHNATHNEVMDGIFRNAHAPARRCHVVGWQYGYLFIRIADVKKVSTTTSIMKGIFKTERLISKNAVPLSLSGFKSAIHRFV